MQLLPLLLPLSAFQFTPLREGRQKYFCDMCGTEIFQFTPLREGRLSPLHTLFVQAGLFQFTPLREGRRYLPDSTGYAI